MISLNDMILHKSERLNEKYYEIKHRSGLRIYVFPKNFSTCYGVIGTDFGSVDDKFKVDGKDFTLPSGTAHFLEHKLFEGETEDAFTISKKLMVTLDYHVNNRKRIFQAERSKYT